MGKRILLAGNGINDAQKISWNEILGYVQDKLTEEEKLKPEEKFDIRQSKIPPTLIFEFFCKKIQEGERYIREIVKEYVEDKSNFVQKLWSLYDVILTTNFDNNLVISKANIVENQENPKEKSLTDNNRFLKRRLKFQYNNSKKEIFFIHGYYRDPDTICLGFNQYIDNLKRIENFIIENYPKNKEFKTAAKKKSVSWVDYFFMNDTDIDILGLNLCSDEIDLWWILNYRASIFKRLKNNHVHFYDLGNNKIQNENNKYYSDRATLLKSMKVDVEFIEKAEGYDSDFYSLCLRKIKEYELNDQKVSALT